MQSVYNRDFSNKSQLLKNPKAYYRKIYNMLPFWKWISQLNLFFFKHFTTIIPQVMTAVRDDNNNDDDDDDAPKKREYVQFYAHKFLSKKIF